MERSSEAIEKEIVKHYPSLLMVARRYVGSRGEAEDLVQTALLRAVERRERLAPGSNVRAWLARVIRNLAIDASRRVERRIASDLDPTLLPSLPADPPRPWEKLSLADIKTALGRCPLYQREAFRLHYLQGLSLKQISTALQVPIGTVSVRLYRARARLHIDLLAMARNQAIRAGDTTLADQDNPERPRGRGRPIARIRPGRPKPRAPQRGSAERGGIETVGSRQEYGLPQQMNGRRQTRTHCR